jgi:two-component system, NarL family, nitrate/nitrite sensor histidine kinase NarX
VFHDRTGIRLDVENAAGPLHLSDAQEVQVFHIVQEALANVAKHSSAQQARLVIRRGTGELEVLIEDDGSGMVPQAEGPGLEAGVAVGHFGMDIMRGRAERLGGTIAVSRNEGGGTRVRLCFPTTPRKASA